MGQPVERTQCKMNRIIFFRRKKLGLGSVRGMSHYINADEQAPIKRKMGGYIGEKSGYVRNDYLNRMPEFDPNTDYLIRWGCTSRTENIPLKQQLNPSNAITEVGYKRDFRMKSQDKNVGVPISIFSLPAGREFFENNPEASLVVRRGKHAQGKDLWVANSYAELFMIHQGQQLSDDWYASELIDKAREFRVYIVEGRVVTIAEKTPENPDAVAWNVAQGGEFNVLKWDEWVPIMDGIRVAVDSFNITSLDFAGVDIMMSKTGEFYQIEINSAPSLPLLSDGSISYRQKCMAKAFEYIRDNGRNTISPITEYEGWRDVIHPAIWKPKKER